MRVLALHSDVIVAVSSIWQTTCTAVRSGDEGFLIDSPVLPAELEALPGVLQQAGFPVSGLIASHGDWDHLLGTYAFPDAPLGCSETTAERLSGEAETTQRELSAFDLEFLIQRAPLELPSIQKLPVPGRLELGADAELELLPAPGHTPDGLLLHLPQPGVVVCGDYLSPHEIPTISGASSPSAYLETLERLRPLLETTRTVVPGHGAPYPAAEAMGILTEDAAYVAALARDGMRAALPPARDSAPQRTAHEHNVLQLAGEAKGYV
jgi:glyoxylase-like metal-dependent hydrolase (beta-lactamase superfamily II)